MKIALSQINPLIGDFKRQYERITAAAQAAKAESCDLVIFPELALCGYPPRDLLEKRSFVQANRRCLDQLTATIQGIGVIVGFVAENPAETGNLLYNCAVLFENGRILHQVCKQLLPAYDVFDERRFFEPGQPSKPCAYKGRHIGLTICEDAWNDKDVFKRRRYAADPVSQLAADGADLLVNIAASPFHKGKLGFRDQLLASAARKHHLTVVFVNQVGGNDHILFDGASAVFDPLGERVARGADFEEDMVVFDTVAGKGAVHPVCASETESVLKALIMGTRDYVTKCGFEKVIVGLSGGVDSALTAWIASQALGPERVFTVFMPSRYTSRDNYEHTRTLAQNLAIDYRVLPIDAAFDTLLNQLVPDADPADPGITEQNIQARIRGTILMGISNRDGCMVLSTGNKSELAVGYCTLYGDMNGGLSVISDVPKTLVYEICHRINREREIIPRAILEKPPSAELKPDQTDQDDLPPYEVIDPILKGYIEDALSAEELVAAGFDPHAVSEITRRVDQNEYKRHQAAPGLKVTAKAFGEGRRYPIAKRFRPL
jgi:NAD+ synthetase